MFTNTVNSGVLQSNRLLFQLCGVLVRIKVDSPEFKHYQPTDRCTGFTEVKVDTLRGINALVLEVSDLLYLNQIQRTD